MLCVARAERANRMLGSSIESPCAMIAHVSVSCSVTRALPGGQGFVAGLSDTERLLLIMVPPVAMAVIAITAGRFQVLVASNF